MAGRPGRSAAPRPRAAAPGARSAGRDRPPGEGDALAVGIVGMGVIGRAIARAIEAGLPGIRLAGVTVRDPARAAPYPACSLATLIRRSDLVVEAATQSALLEMGPAVLGAGRDLMVLSVGGLLEVLEDWTRLAAARGCRILVPSGAIAGLDGVKGACQGRVDRVTMETRKPPRGLAGAPWITARGLDLDAIRDETLVFEGPAREAVRAFPANVNVVAALSLAGIGPDLTRIRVFAVPGLTRNLHRITVEGEFGRLGIEVDNVPSENPRTGRLSYLSAIALLRELGAAVRVGT